MRAVAHGWQPDKTKAPPVEVAKEFVSADKQRERAKQLRKVPA